MNRMKNLRRELNEFFAATSIHGFPYIHIGQTRSTRILWSILVVIATGVASNLLYQTFIGYETKGRKKDQPKRIKTFFVFNFVFQHISTTIQTESVEKFPFPAITFYPGDFASENSFLRTFLNQFQFTRYNKTNPLHENEIFLKTFSSFVKGFGHGLSVLEWVSDYLLDEKLFISKKGGVFRTEVCSLLTLNVKNKVSASKLQGTIADIFNENLFKFKEFSPVVKEFMKKSISPLIEETMAAENISKSEINSECKKTENAEMKKKLESFLLSYLFVFINNDNVEVGAGDIAAEDFFEVKDYLSRQLTSLYNDLTGGRVESSHWSKSHQILCSDWWNFTTMTPRSIP